MDWFFLKFGVKFMYLIQNITVAILLQITELLMEPVFICECNKYRVCFVVMYFTIPAFAFTAFAWSLRQGNIFMKICKCCGENPNPNPPENTGASSVAAGNNATENTSTSSDAGDNNDIDCCKKCTKSCCWRTCRPFLSFCKTLYPAFCWGVILLIDGKYLACGLYSKCNSTMTIVDMKDPEMVNGMMRSKIWGLTVVGSFVLLYFIYPYVDCWCRSDANRYEEMYMSQLEEDREEFARKYAKTCSERRRAWCEEELKKAESQPRAGNPTPSGAGNPTPSGAGNPTPSGAESTAPSGAESTESSGAESTAPSGAGNPTSSGAGNPTSSGAENPTSSGAGHPTSSGAENPTSSGSWNPTSSGAERKTQPGAGRGGDPVHIELQDIKSTGEPQHGAAGGGDPGHIELQDIISTGEPQHRAAGRGDPGPADLNAKTIVNTIKKYFSIKNEPGLCNKIMDPSQHASETGEQLHPDQVSSRPRSNPHQPSDRTPLLANN